MYNGFEGVYGNRQRQVHSIKEALAQMDNAQLFKDTYDCLIAPSLHPNPSSAEDGGMTCTSSETGSAVTIMVPTRARGIDLSRFQCFATLAKYSYSQRVATNMVGPDGATTTRTTNFASATSDDVSPSAVNDVFQFCSEVSTNVTSSDHLLDVMSFTLAVFHLECLASRMSNEIGADAVVPEPHNILTTACKRHLSTYLMLHSARDRVMTPEVLLTPSMLRLRWSAVEFIRKLFYFFSDNQERMSTSQEYLLAFFSDFNLYPQQISTVVLERIFEMAHIRDAWIGMETFWDLIVHTAITLYSGKNVRLGATEDEGDMAAFVAHAPPPPTNVYKEYCTYESRVLLLLTSVLELGARQMQIITVDELALLPLDEIPRVTVKECAPNTIDVNVKGQVRLKGENFNALGNGTYVKLQYVKDDMAVPYAVIVHTTNVTPDGCMAYVDVPPLGMASSWDRSELEGELRTPDGLDDSTVSEYVYSMVFSHNVSVVAANAVDDFSLLQVTWGGFTTPCDITLRSKTDSSTITSSTINLMKDIFIAGCQRTSPYNQNFLHLQGWEYVQQLYKLQLTDSELRVASQVFHQISQSHAADVTGGSSIKLDQFIYMMMRLVVGRRAPVNTHEGVLRSIFEEGEEMARFAGGLSPGGGSSLNLIPPQRGYGIGATLRRASLQVQALRQGESVSFSEMASRRSSAATTHTRRGSTLGSTDRDRTWSELSGIIENLQQDWEEVKSPDSKNRAMSLRAAAVASSAGSPDARRGSMKYLDALAANRNLRELAATKDTLLQRQAAHEQALVDKLRSEVVSLRVKVADKDSAIESQRATLFTVTRSLRELESYIGIFVEQVGLESVKSRGIANIYHELCKNVVSACTAVTAATTPPTTVSLKTLGYEEREHSISQLVALTAEASARVTAARHTMDTASRRANQEVYNIQTELNDVTEKYATVVCDLQDSSRKQAELRDQIAALNQERESSQRTISEYKSREVALRVQLEELKAANASLVAARERQARKDRATERVQRALTPPDQGLGGSNGILVQSRIGGNNNKRSGVLQNIISRTKHDSTSGSTSPGLPAQPTGRTASQVRDDRMQEEMTVLREALEDMQQELRVANAFRAATVTSPSDNLSLSFNDPPRPDAFTPRFQEIQRQAQRLMHRHVGVNTEYGGGLKSGTKAPSGARVRFAVETATVETQTKVTGERMDRRDLHVRAFTHSFLQGMRQDLRALRSIVDTGFSLDEFADVVNAFSLLVRSSHGGGSLLQNSNLTARLAAHTSALSSAQRSDVFVPSEPVVFITQLNQNKRSPKQQQQRRFSPVTLHLDTGDRNEGESPTISITSTDSAHRHGDGGHDEAPTAAPTLAAQLPHLDLDAFAAETVTTLRTPQDVKNFMDAVRQQFGAVRKDYVISLLHRVRYNVQLRVLEQRHRVWQQHRSNTVPGGEHARSVWYEQEQRRVEERLAQSAMREAHCQLQLKSLTERIERAQARYHEMLETVARSPTEPIRKDVTSSTSALVVSGNALLGKDETRYNEGQSSSHHSVFTAEEGVAPRSILKAPDNIPTQLPGPLTVTALGMNPNPDKMDTKQNPSKPRPLPLMSLVKSLHVLSGQVGGPPPLITEQQQQRAQTRELAPPLRTIIEKPVAPNRDNAKPMPPRRALFSRQQQNISSHPTPQPPKRNGIPTTTNQSSFQSLLSNVMTGRLQQSHKQVGTCTQQKGGDIPRQRGSGITADVVRAPKAPAGLRPSTLGGQK